MARAMLGWRLYVTNAEVNELPSRKAYDTYRGAITIERGRGRLKGKPLGLAPIQIQRDDHVKGLTRLLFLALMVLTLTEFFVRRNLAQAQRELSGLYAGNPRRATQKPTTEAMLRVFTGLTLSAVTAGGRLGYHITPLNDVQHKILHFLALDANVYGRLAIRPGRDRPPG
ncbi:MAG: hypothetical protein HYV63_12370 [Candidatus Schekmanbacteria bacterium]|nr:hypothetical protein [Candidatus Schekmanbacteria bacterium]